jgi:hypothetical protein
VSVAYALVFPETEHYLTFPANIGPPQNRVFGDYDTTQHPEYHDETFVFEAGTPYRFVARFDFMVCRLIPIDLSALR